MTNFNYGYETTLAGISFDDAVVRVTAELKKEGFGVLTEIDVKATFKKKLDVDFRRYLILGACNPHFAHQAIEAEANIGLLLPCNVVVQETRDGAVAISIADPRAMFSLVDNANAAHLADEVDAGLRRVLRAIADRAA